jgi:hypothetical protein
MFIFTCIEKKSCLISAQRQPPLSLQNLGFSLGLRLKPVRSAKANANVFSKPPTAY